MTVTRPLGYRDPAYADSLSEYGKPLHLPHSGGWILERPIPGSCHRDGMGLYPLLCCNEWSALSEDLEILRREGLVSLTAVSDPFKETEDAEAFAGFDLVRPFKTHFATHLDRPIEQVVSKHHAYYARRAARTLHVHWTGSPLAHLDEWHELYCGLVLRHRISDLRRFSKDSFRKLLGIPGLCLFRALLGEKTVGAQLFMQQGDVVHSHLAAFAPEGYSHGASYVLDWEALNHYRGKARVLNWGGGLGSGDDDGLARYKQGWATEQHTSYLLGAILGPGAYAALSQESQSDYFPAYRRGEFRTA